MQLRSISCQASASRPLHRVCQAVPHHVSKPAHLTVNAKAAAEARRGDEVHQLLP